MEKVKSAYLSFCLVLLSSTHLFASKDILDQPSKEARALVPAVTAVSINTEKGISLLAKAVNTEVVGILERLDRYAQSAQSDLAGYAGRALLNHLYRSSLDTVDQLSSDYKMGLEGFSTFTLNLEGSCILTEEDAERATYELEQALKMVRSWLNLHVVVGNNSPQSDPEALDLFQSGTNRIIDLLLETHDQALKIDERICACRTLVLTLEDDMGAATPAVSVDAEIEYQNHLAVIDNICDQFRYGGIAILMPESTLTRTIFWNGKPIIIASLTTNVLGLNGTDLQAPSHIVTTSALLDTAKSSLDMTKTSIQAYLDRLTTYQKLALVGFVPDSFEPQ